MSGLLAHWMGQYPAISRLSRRFRAAYNSRAAHYEELWRLLVVFNYGHDGEEIIITLSRHLRVINQEFAACRAGKIVRHDLKYRILCITTMHSGSSWSTTILVYTKSGMRSLRCKYRSWYVSIEDDGDEVDLIGPIHYWIKNNSLEFVSYSTLMETPGRNLRQLLTMSPPFLGAVPQSILATIELHERNTW